MFRTVIFDLDLTLIDSAATITFGVNELAKHFKLPLKSKAEVVAAMSLSNDNLWQQLWGYTDPVWTKHFLDIVSQVEKDTLELMPGAEDLLFDLKRKGLRLALATNRTTPWRSLVTINLAKYFDTAVGAGDVLKGKPEPDMLLSALRQTGSLANQSVYIGDAPSDMLAAQAASMRAIGVLTGGHNRDDLISAGAWQVRQSVSDLRDLLDL